MTGHHIAMLEELGAEFARVADEHEGARRLRRSRSGALGPSRRGVALAASAVLALSAGAYAVPTTRAAIDDLTGSFAAWVAGTDADPPGRALRPADDAPRWVAESGGRLIAESGGVKLFVTRTHTERRGTDLGFSLGGTLAAFDSIDGWRERFDKHAIVLLGSTGATDSRGRNPLLGVTARSVDSVELRYASGPPLTADGIDGGFVLLADAQRATREIVAYDSDGRELDRTDTFTSRTPPLP